MEVSEQSNSAHGVLAGLAIIALVVAGLSLAIESGNTLQTGGGGGGGCTPTCVQSIIKGTHTLNGNVTFANSTSIGMNVDGQTIYWKILSVAWGNLTDYPAACSAGQFVTHVGSSLSCGTAVLSISQGNQSTTGAVNFVNTTTVGVYVSGHDVYFNVGSIDWSLLTNFPAGCSSNQYVTSVGSSLSCSQVSWAGLTGFPSQCTTGQFAYGVNSTALECATPSGSGGGVTNITQGAHTVTGAITFVNSTSIGIDVAGQDFTFKLLSQACTSGKYVTTVANTVICSGAVVSLTQGAHTTQGAITFVNSTTIGVEVVGQNYYFNVGAVPWSLLTSFPSGCSSNEFVTAVGSTLTCAQPTWSNLTGFPAACSSGYYVTQIATSPTCTQAVVSLTQGSYTVQGAITFANSTSIGIQVAGSTMYWKIIAVSWSALTGFPSGCSAGEFVTAVGSTLTCATPASSFPSATCSTNQFATGASSTTLQCSSADYSGLSGFPSACPSYPIQFVKQIASTPVCALPPQPNNATALVAYWPLDEGSGTSAYDLTGSGHTGTLVNSPAWEASSVCKYGGCLLFAGGSSQYVTIPSAATLSPEAGGSGQITLSAWVYITSSGATGDIISKGASSNYEYELRLDGSGDAFFIVYVASGASDICDEGTTALTVDGWNLVVGTYTAGVSCNAYLNGVLSSTGSPAAGSATAGTAAVYLGGRADSTRYLSGSVDDPRIYSVALGANYVAQLYQSVPFNFENAEQALLNLTCPTGQYFSSITIVPSCSAVSYANLTNFPSACSSSYFVTAIAASPTCTQVSWAGLTNFPAACSAGEFVTAVGTSLTCSSATFSIASTSCSAGSAVVQAASTTVSCSAEAGSSIASTSCGANSAVVQGATTTLSCAAQPYISTAATVSCSSQNFVTTIGTATAICSQPILMVGPETTSQLFKFSVAAVVQSAVTGLSVSVAASTTYSILAWIPYTCPGGSPSSGGFGFSAPSGSTLTLNIYNGASGGGLTATFQTATSLSSTTACTTTQSSVYISGYLTTASTSGSFAIIFNGLGQSSPNTATYTVDAGGWLQLINPAA